VSRAEIKAPAKSGNLNIPHLASHSMRKSRGYHLFQAGVPIEHICKMFNHASTATTLNYIGITGETVSEMYLNLEL
jgi:site-specific recombinase XerD